MKKIAALFLILLLLRAHTGWAEFSEAVDWTGTSIADTGKDLGSAGLNVVKFAGGVLWLTVEVVVFPFRFLMAKI